MESMENEGQNSKSEIIIPTTGNLNRESNLNIIENVSTKKIHNLTIDTFNLKENPKYSTLRSDYKYEGFDTNVGNTWIYPINNPIKAYQQCIVEAALHNNTLAVLPPSLDKTFIASVVMYNVYRWYPKGKIMFLAPTYKLITQQINECCNVTGLSKANIAQITAKTMKSFRRNDQWLDKRFFFATPQVIQADIIDPESSFPFENIKLIVIDEAHKPSWKNAIVDIVKSIKRKNNDFRILAFTETSARNVVDIELIQSLLISHVELRYKTSVDVAPYIYKRNIKTIVIPLGDELFHFRNELIDIIDPYLRILIEEGVVSENKMNSKSCLLIEKRKFCQRSRQMKINYSETVKNFSICISLYHALELLEKYGLRVVMNYFDETDSEEDKGFVNINFNIKKYIEKLHKWYTERPTFDCDIIPYSNNIAKDFDHPKFKNVTNILSEYYQDKAQCKAIIFCESRESILLVKNCLQNNQIITSRCFDVLGQEDGIIRAMSSAQQVKILNEFRAGSFNTLIATYVAEENICVDEVDLIICFDISTKFPTNIIQRLERTSLYKQDGEIVVLAMEGKEHSIIKNFLEKRKESNVRVMGCSDSNIAAVLCKSSPKLVPPEVNLKCVEVFIKRDCVTFKSPGQAENKKHNSQNISKNNIVGNSLTKPQTTLTKEQKYLKLKITERLIPATENNTIDEIDFNVSDFNNSKYRRELQKTIIDLEKEYKTLNHMNRLLEKEIKINDSSNSIEELLKAKNFNNFIKKYIIFKNENFVNEVLVAIGNNEREICDFELIKNVLGNHVKIQTFIRNFQQRKRKRKHIEVFQERLTYDIDFSFKGIIKTKPCDKFDNFYMENLFNNELSSIDALDISNIRSQLHRNLQILKTNEEETDEELEKTKFISQFTPIQNLSHTEMKAKCVRDPIQVQNLTNIVKIANFQNIDEFSNKEKEEEEKLLRKVNLISPKIVDTKSQPNSVLLIKDNVSMKDFFKDNCTKPTTHETSAELFNEAFDEMLVATENLIQREFENNLKTNLTGALLEPKKLEQTWKNEKPEAEHLINGEKISKVFSESNVKVSMDQSMMTVSQILEAVSKKEDFYSKKFKTNNIEIDYFNINDFEEPFGMENKNTLSPEIANYNERNIDISDKKMLELDMKSQSTSIKSAINSKYSHSGHDNSNNVFNTSNISDIEYSSNIRNVEPNLLSSWNLKTKALYKTSPKKTSPSLIRCIKSRLEFKRGNNNIDIDKFYIDSNTSRFYKSKNSIDSVIFDNKLIVTDEDTFSSPERKTKRHPIILDSEMESTLKNDSSYSGEGNIIFNSTSKHRRTRNHRKGRNCLRKCSFIDDEAGHSSDSKDDDDLTNYYDSIILQDDDIENHVDTNLYIKYIHSTKSPLRNGMRGFKIPSPREYRDMSNILSQPIDDYDDSLNCYEDSFIVSDEDSCDAEVQEISPLSRAEAILRKRKYNKRKKRLNPSNKVKRRRIVNNIIEISDGEDD